MAHLRDQIVQPRLDGGTDRLAITGIAGGVKHPPHRPHRLAAQGHDCRRRIMTRHGVGIDPGRQDDAHGHARLITAS